MPIPSLLTALLLAAPGTPRAELFAPGVVSTRDYERDGSFSPDGRTFYFTKRTMWPGFSAICVTHLRGGRWSEPEVAPFSGRWADLTPFASSDGKRVYFASRRPVDGRGPSYNLWMVDRVADGWSAPRPLPAPVNGGDGVIAPVETRDGSLYFLDLDSARVMVARRRGDGWATPAPAAAPSGAGTAELGAWVDPDERFMIVSVVGRDDALNTAEGVYPRADLYARERRGAEWSELRHLDAPVNSAADEGAPFVSPDGRYLYFMSERGALTEHGASFTADALARALHGPGNGLGDIYRVDFRLTGIAR